jgi:hypothetical protein
MHSRPEMLEGLCHQCQVWIPLQSNKGIETAIPELFWWKVRLVSSAFRPFTHAVALRSTPKHAMETLSLRVQEVTTLKTKYGS